MNRRRKDILEFDTSMWPRVDTNALSAAQKSVFEKRQKAIELYVGGAVVRLIEEQTGVNRRQLYFLLDRCLASDTNGRIVGFPGLIKYKHFATYTRTAALKTTRDTGGVGLVGAFSLLLDHYPPLADWLKLKIRERAVILRQISTEGVLKTRLLQLDKLHAGFLMQCRAVGLTSSDYPMNTDHRGIQSLSAYVTAAMLNNFGLAARAAGASHLKGMPLTDGGTAAAVRQYQVVEFDGHRLDVRLKIVIKDPLGFEQKFEIERIWLLVIMSARVPYSATTLFYHENIAATTSLRLSRRL